MSLTSQKSMKSPRSHLSEKKKIENPSNFESNKFSFEKPTPYENPFLRGKITSQDNFDLVFDVNKENHDIKYTYYQLIISS